MVFQDATEKAIWSEIDNLKLSPSHDHWHIDLVLEYANQLWKIYGGDIDVLKAAIILHDLGRIDPKLRGITSIDHSVSKARKILSNLNFPKDKINKIIIAIEEHGQPNFSPSTIEGKILKDADFLAGFGAWGVLRIALWAGETGDGIDRIIDRINNGMMNRLNNLEFLESMRLGFKETLFSQLFLNYLLDDNKPEVKRRNGKYIIFEGISGSGKNTQAELLEKRLSNLSRNILLVSEPSDFYNKYSKLWKLEYQAGLDDSILRHFMLIADRHKLVHDTINPALDNGEIVFSVRSFISFLVYQCYEEKSDSYRNLDVAEMAFIQRFVPVPDLIILYDTEPELALQRIIDREKERSRYEKLQLLKSHSKQYLNIANSDPWRKITKVINANGRIEEIAEETYNFVTRVINE